MIDLKGTVKLWRMGPLLAVVLGGFPVEAGEPRSRLLENESLSIRVQRQGAIISNLQLKGGANWMGSKLEAWEGMYAHFLCFDRWGAVSEEERQRGITYHGEAVQQTWKRQASGVRSETLAVTLPIIGLNAQRTVLLAEKGGAFRITNTFTNPTGHRLPYNVVEHVTLSAFAHSAGARLSSNADRGRVERAKVSDGEAMECFIFLSCPRHNWNTFLPRSFFFESELPFSPCYLRRPSGK